MNYAKTLRNVPQTVKPVGVPNMVKNNAGGYGFKIEDFDRLIKFCTIGTEGGTYYVDEQKLTQAEAAATIRVLKADAPKGIAEIIDILTKNRAHKRNAALFALALASCVDIVPVAQDRKLVFDALPSVLRTGTDMFIYVGYVAQLRGHGGQGLQKALSNWYASKNANDLAYQLMKYQSREGWSHRDILRIARPGAGSRAKLSDPTVRALVRWALSGFDSAADEFNIAAKDGKIMQALPDRVKAVNYIRREQENLGAKVVAAKIREFDLPREVIPTQYLNEKMVWEALIERMPMLGTIRNLGAMSSKGFMTSFSPIEKAVLARLQDEKAVERSGIHPFHVLLAARTYRSGHGERGTNSWTVNKEVVAALDTTLLASLRNPTPSGKNILVFIDVSGSMSSLQDKAHTLGYCFRAIEPNARVLQFDAAGYGRGSIYGDRYAVRGGSKELIPGVYDPGITAKSSLDDVLSKIRNGGGTDVGLPFKYVIDNKLENTVDAVVMITDSESWAGGQHTFQLVDQIRAKNKNFKAVEVQMTPHYHKQLRGHAKELLVCGFDASVYSVVSDFIAD